MVTIDLLPLRQFLLSFISELVKLHTVKSIRHSKTEIEHNMLKYVTALTVKNKNFNNY